MALRQRRKELGTRWRRLDPGQQALLVVAHLCKSETYAKLASGFEIGVSTAYRYVCEGLALLRRWPRACSRRWRSPWARPTRQPAAHRSSRDGLRQ